MPYWLQNAHFSYTFDNAPVIEPEDLFFVTEELEQVEVSTDIPQDHSQNTVYDSISFEGELSIIQNDVFDLPEACWKHITG